MAKQRFSIFLIVITLLDADLSAQTGEKRYPAVGKPCPDFTLSNLTHYSKKQASLDDFNGKWLILDFWTKGCKACVFSFPKINQLQKEFKEEIQFILIGKNDTKYNKNIEEMYERFRKTQDLQLTVAYDTLLFAQFGIQTVPHIVIMNKNGIVYAITDSRDINRENLQALKDGRNPLFWKKNNLFENSLQERVDITKPLLIDGNGGDDSDFLYRSLLAQWKNSTPHKIRKTIDYQLQNGCFQSTGIMLRWLYNLAYFGVNDWLFSDSLYGKVSKFPILKLKDSTLFQYDLVSGRGIYNYSLIVPMGKATKEYLQKVMQGDLKNYFGYEASVETRMTPCWKLVVTSNRTEDKLSTKGASRTYKGDHSGFRMTNVPISIVLQHIQSYHQSEPPFVDGTGITKNVDISVDAIMTDLERIKEALERAGLTLVKEKKEMKVLVVMDSPN